MKASVIITNYNFGRYIEEAIYSVLNQTYQNFELIIVDDGSTDDSLQIIKTYESNPKVKIILKSNGGQVSCLNSAFSSISGDIVFFLDSDDVFLPDYINNTIALFKSNNSIDIISCQHIDTDVNGVALRRREFQKQQEGFTLLTTYYLQETIGNITSTISLRTYMLKKIMPLEIEADWSKHCIDTVIHYGIALACGKALQNNEYLVSRKIHGENFTVGWSKGEALTVAYRQKRHFQIIRLFNFILNKFNANIKSYDFLFAREFISRKPKSLKLVIKYLHVLLLMNQSIVFKISMVLLILRTSFRDKKS